MSKVAVVYWSGTGNTEAMAMAVAEGVKGKGAEVSVITAAEFSPEQVGEYSAIAFGCPSMGSEQLEESEFEPMFAALEGSLNGKKIALFGSYGWGDVSGCATGHSAHRTTAHSCSARKGSSAMKPPMMTCRPPAVSWAQIWLLGKTHV